LHVILDGLRLVIVWPTIGFMLIGVVLGLFFGAVPGLGGIVAMSILLPFSFGMDPPTAFAFLLGMYAVTTTSDSLPAVLLGVPGTAAGAATVVDGYPMAQRGEATRALGAAFSVSALGGVLGSVALAASIPFVQPLVLSFGPPEYFMLGLFGLTCVGALTGRSLFKGLLAALFGILLSTVGYSTQGGNPRFYFGTVYLLAGLPLVPLALGLFGLPEIIYLSAKNATIAKSGEEGNRSKQMLLGIQDTFRNWWLVLRASLIGIYVGMLPGAGGAVADWVAYGHAVQSARDKSMFGKGDVRGVIAPEAANHSVKCSAMLPTIAFGIPGTPGLAVMMGAFLIHGLRPGPDMLTTNLDLTMSFIWTLVIANVVGASLLLIWGNQLARITFLRGNLIVPMIMLFVFMGSWTARNQLGDWWTLIALGVIGYVFKQAGWARPPVILGFILGPIMETNLDLSYQAMQLRWLGRPIVLVMIGLLVLALGFSVWKNRWRDRGKQSVTWSVEGPGTGHPTLSLGLALIATAMFAAALYQATKWPLDARFFPVAVTVPALVLCAVVVWRDSIAWARGGRVLLDKELAEFLGDSHVFVVFLVVVALTVLAGQLIAIPLVVFLYLMWVRERWTIALAQALVAVLILYLVFDRVLHIVWYPSLI
jgi:TctA family transporter